jgi:uncharacterized protein (TIGR04222 family)
MGCVVEIVLGIAAGFGMLAAATQAPGPAAAGLGLILVAALAGPELADRHGRRSARVVRRARRWIDEVDDPVEVAFALGGPTRVADVVLADLVADGLVEVDGTRLVAVPSGSERPGDPAPEPDSPGQVDALVRRRLLDRLTAVPASWVEQVRRDTARDTALVPLWRAALAAGLLRTPVQRRYTQLWITLAASASTFGLCIALLNLPALDLHVGSTAGFGLGLCVTAAAGGVFVFCMQRAKRLTGYDTDPRSHTGMRIADLAPELLARAQGPDARRYAVAVDGLRNYRQLGPGGDGRVPFSYWHVAPAPRAMREPPFWPEATLEVADAWESVADAHDGDGDGVSDIA